MKIRLFFLLYLFVGVLYGQNEVLFYNEAISTNLANYIKDTRTHRLIPSDLREQRKHELTLALESKLLNHLKDEIETLIVLYDLEKYIDKGAVLSYKEGIIDLFSKKESCKNKNLKLLAWYRYSYAVLYVDDGEFEEIISVINELLEDKNECLYKVSLVRGYSSMGALYAYSELFSLAIDNLNKALNITEDIDKKDLFWTKSKLAYVVAQTADFDYAIKLRYKLLKQKNLDSITLTYVYTGLAQLYYDQKKNLDSLNHYANKAYNLSLVLQDSLQISSSLRFKGIYFYEKNELTQAADFFSKAVEFTPNRYMTFKVVNHLVLAKINLAENDLIAAEKNLNLASELISNNNINRKLRHLTILYETKRDIAYAKKDFDNAFIFFTKYDEYKSQLNNERYNNKIREQLNRYELIEKEKKLIEREKNETELLLSLKKQSSKNNTLVIVLIFSCVTLVLVGAFFYVNFLKRTLLKHQLNIISIQKKQLVVKQEKLEASITEQKLLLKELQHRVKNNLQIILSLIRLHKSKNKYSSIEDFSLNIENKIVSIAKTHSFLITETNNNELSVCLNNYIKDLVNSVIKSLAHKDTVEVVFLLDKVSIQLNKAINVGLIVNEAITNAIKYAFEDTSNPQLTIRIKGTLNVLEEISITDNGKGFKPDLKNKSGIELIELIAQNIKASASLLNMESGGASVQLKFQPKTN